MTNSNYQVQIINGLAERIHTVTVHAFTMGDVDDPEIYAAQLIWQWQQTDEGRWIMAHALEQPELHRQTDWQNFGYRFVIRARLRGRDCTFWSLKWACS